jgi:hypothetical protein
MYSMLCVEDHEVVEGESDTAVKLDPRYGESVENTKTVISEEVVQTLTSLLANQYFHLDHHRMRHPQIAQSMHSQQVEVVILRLTDRTKGHLGRFDGDGTRVRKVPRQAVWCKDRVGEESMGCSCYLTRI